MSQIKKIGCGLRIFTTILTLGVGGLSIAAPIPADCKVGDFYVGCQAYTFHKFTVFEAIEKTAQAGGKVIEFFPGQNLSPEQPDTKWDHNASPEVIQKVKNQLAKYHVRAVGYGVVTPKDGEAEWRKVFEFAKKLGLYSITTESVEELNTIERLVKEFDIKVGIHEHKRKENNLGYKVWDPKYVLSIVKGRDKRIGACADTGHWATSGLKPLECIKILKGRIVSVHLKDRTEIGKQIPDTVYGTGVSDIKGILDALKRQHFDGQIAIEYENKWDHSVPDVAQCVGYVRGHSAATK
jgi:sugar phosphate isomerase/epimerase